MAKKLYMEVTKDELSLPLAVADTAQELARICGVKPLQVLHGVSKSKQLKRPRWVCVKLEEEEG